MGRSQTSKYMGARHGQGAVDEGAGPMCACRCQVHIVLEVGLEPAISSLGGRRLIHQATRALGAFHVYNAITIQALDS